MISGTLIFRCINRQLVVILLLSLVASAFFLIPSATNLKDFFIYSSLIGLGSGGYDTAQVAWIIDIWRDESPPWILGQHFAYSLGTLASPVIIANFLPNHNSTDELEFTTSSPASQIDIHIPFYIAGFMAIVSVVINLIIHFAFVSRNRYFPIDSNIQEPPVAGTSWERNRNARKRKIYVIGLSCCVIGFYSALELCTQQFLPTYTHFSPMKLSPTDGARVLFGLQLGFTISRFVGIILVQRVRPHFIFVGNLILLTISNTILFIWGGSSMTMLWVGSVMIGVGMSTVYPSLYAFIEKYLNITETVSGVITISGGFISSIYPVIVGNSVEAKPEILMYVNYISISVCYVSFSLLFCMTYMRSSRGYVRI